MKNGHRAECAVPVLRLGYLVDHYQEDPPFELTWYAQVARAESK